MKSKTPTKRRPRATEAEDGTLTDRAYRELEEMIVTLQLSPGTVLSEQALAARLKIGRTPIREALQRLARDGLVVIMPRRGIMVSEINLRLQLRLLEVRRELERLMASLAAERVRNAQQVAEERPPTGRDPEELEVEADRVETAAACALEPRLDPSHDPDLGAVLLDLGRQDHRRDDTEVVARRKGGRLEPPIETRGAVPQPREIENEVHIPAPAQAGQTHILAKRRPMAGRLLLHCAGPHPQRYGASPLATLGARRVIFYRLQALGTKISSKSAIA